MPDFFVGNKSKTNFQDLMPHRIHEILLVASVYDAFILEEDGHLTEQILTEYIGMNFNYAPRVTRVSTGREAIDIMVKKKSFLDLKVSLFYNKKNGQMSISLPKKKFKNLFEDDDSLIPKKIPIRFFGWGKKKGGKK